MKYARFAGILVQSLVLGFALFLAVARLIGIESGALIFRYQAF